MSLLKALGLPPTQAMNSAPKPPPPMVDPDAKKVRASIALQRQKAADTVAKLDGIAPALEKKIAAASGDEKKKSAAGRGKKKKRLGAAKAEFEKKRAEAAHALTQANEDLEALDNPATRRE